MKKYPLIPPSLGKGNTILRRWIHRPETNSGRPFAELRETSSPGRSFSLSGASLYVNRVNSPSLREFRDFYGSSLVGKAFRPRCLYSIQSLVFLFYSPSLEDPCSVEEDATNDGPGRLNDRKFTHLRRNEHATRASFTIHICNNCQFTRYDTFHVACAAWQGIANKFREKFSSHKRRTLRRFLRPRENRKQMCARLGFDETLTLSTVYVNGRVVRWKDRVFFSSRV